MTTKNIEARRKAFEAWANNRGASLAKDLAGHYLIAENEWAFDIWNAAIDSICVELPSPKSLSASDDPWWVLECCQDAITAAGVAYK